MIAEEWLNKVVNISWPFSIEAKIVAVMDANTTYRAPSNELISAPTEYFEAKATRLLEQ